MFGTYRFNSRFHTQEDVSSALDRLSDDSALSALVAAHRSAVLDTFGDVFGLRSFTGRSGTMYGYEGLGCIYWHMVSKLLLAIQENWLRGGRQDDIARG